MPKPPKSLIEQIKEAQAKKGIRVEEERVEAAVPTAEQTKPKVGKLGKKSAIKSPFGGVMPDKVLKMRLAAGEDISDLPGGAEYLEKNGIGPEREGAASVASEPERSAASPEAGDSPRPPRPNFLGDIAKGADKLRKAPAGLMDAIKDGVELKEADQLTKENKKPEGLAAMAAAAAARIGFGKKNKVHPAEIDAVAAEPAKKEELSIAEQAARARSGLRKTKNKEPEVAKPAKETELQRKLRLAKEKAEGHMVSSSATHKVSPSPRKDGKSKSR